MASLSIGEISAVVLDVSDLERAKEFWIRLLGLEVQIEIPDFAFLKPPDGGAGITLQRVDEPRAGKNRAHPDLRVHDRVAARQRVLDLGGSAIAEAEYEGFPWSVMADPDGNEFCIGEG
ncbi:MAG: VOC family protein [Dehalococcoidia bacterium]|jgi:catechol 2,3-dioxygenase-like lactoylglutathione lyase family enzyme|nr:VOC family protein [Dehalococcoidia bacterium]